MAKLKPKKLRSRADWLERIASVKTTGGHGTDKLLLRAAAELRRRAGEMEESPAKVASRAI